MTRGRLEAFSDGVLAVVITIMVLNLRPPDGSAFHDLRPLVPKLSVYLVSFVFVAVYWNNHHHLMQATQRVTGSVLWANAHLLFWLSLTPVAAAWLGPHVGDAAPVTMYGVVLLGSAVAYGILTNCLLVVHGPRSALARAVGRDRKGRLSIATYVVAICVGPFVPWLSVGLYLAVATVWFVPDRRIARIIDSDSGKPGRHSSPTPARAKTL